MRRVAVIGVGGAGKTTFSRELSRRTGLPHVDLDRVFWGPGWEAPEPDAWRRRHREALAAETWIADGNYGSTMVERLALADTAIFLDTPTWLCLVRTVRRSVLASARGRSHLGPDLPERLDRNFLAFLRYIARYRATRRPEVLDRLARAPGDVVILRSRREADAWLDSFTRESPRVAG